MAHVSNTHLRAGRDRNHPNKEFFELTFDVRFSDSDRQLGMEYNYNAAVYEIDEHQLDLYAPLMNQGTLTVQHDQRFSEKRDSDKDDFIGWLNRDPAQPVLRPDADGRTRVTMKLSKDVGNQERGEEEYKALVMLNPTTAPVSTFSNTVRINLG